MIPIGKLTRLFTCLLIAAAMLNGPAVSAQAVQLVIHQL